MSKISAKIYRINDSKFQVGRTGNFIDTYINLYNQSHNMSEYKPIECKEFDSPFKLKFFINGPKSNPVSWAGFARSAVRDEREIGTIKSRNYSFLLFLYSNNEIYAISGGYGYLLLDEILDYDFGFNVVERLIDPNNSEIRAISQRGFIGVELASSRFFKSDFVFNDNDDFGKFYRGLEAFVDETQLADIGVVTDREKLLVRGETGFKIDTQISLDVIIHRVECISNLLSDDERQFVELNPFRSLRPKELSAITEDLLTLEDCLEARLIEQFRDNMVSTIEPDIEIFHPSLLAFLKTDLITVQRRRESYRIPTNRKLFTKDILRKFNVLTDSISEESFATWTSQIRTAIYDESSQLENSNRALREWFMGEVNYQNVRYIKFENAWYKYSVGFMNDLNTRLESMFEKIEVEPIMNWKVEHGDEEGDFNEAFAKSNDALLGDQVFYRGYLELADAISTNQNELMIYHIKKGVDRNLRVLQSQILNSAKVIQEMMLSGGSTTEATTYINSVVAKTSNADGIEITPQNFKDNYLSKSKLRYVFAVATSSRSNSKEQILNEFKRSRSSIPKISLLHTYYTLKRKDIEMSIAKIIKE